MRYFLGAMAGLLYCLSASADFSNLKDIASRSIAINIRTLDSGLYVSAGNLRLLDFWSRDFSFASRGLYVLGRADVVKSELTSMLRYMRAEDGCIPRSLGGHREWWENFLRKNFNYHVVPRDPLSVTYQGGGGSPEAVDSNSLILIAAWEYVQRTGDWAWWQEHLPQLVKAYRYHDHLLKDGLLTQGEFADWQDSVRRTGHVFFANLAYYAASERLAPYPEFGITPEGLAALKQRLIDTFFDPTSGLFHSMPGLPYTSLEDNLLVIDWGVFPAGSAEAAGLYEALKAHPLWTQHGVPGFSTYPDYPEAWIGHAKNQGLRHYHDSLYWSWLMGLSAKVARLMKDEASVQLVLTTLQEIARRDGSIAEVYFSNPPFRRWSFFFSQSERPFAWGSGVILDALAE